MMRGILVAALLALPPAPAFAQSDAVTGTPPSKVRSVTLRAGEKCPPSTGDEIVVCQTLDEPYRIPKELRTLAPSAANQSWVSRTAANDEIGRIAGGLPNTCSTIGSGGQTGCTQQLIKQWAAEQREAARLGPQ